MPRHACCVLFTLLMITAPILRADPVTPLAIAQLLSATGVNPALTPEFARSKNGPSIVAWQEGSGSSAIIRYAILNSQGVMIIAPQALLLPAGTAATRPRVAAGPSSFLLVCESRSPGALSRDILYFGISFAGLVTGGGNASILGTSFDEFDPTCSMGLDGSAAIVWVRANAVAGGPTGGVWLRRLNFAGVPIDAVEVQLSSPNSNFGFQREPAVAISATGRGLAVWTDGEFNLPASAPSPDGHGTAIGGAFWDVLLNIQAGFVATGTITARDQWAPRLSASDRETCALGFTTDVSDTEFEAASILLTMTGQYNPIPGVLTSSVPGNQNLIGVAMTPSEETVALYADAAGTSAGRIGYARATTTVGVFSTGLVDPLPGSSEVQLQGGVSVDDYGNFRAVYTGVDNGTTSLRTRGFRRNMITFSGATVPGSVVIINLESKNDLNRSYILALSLGQGPIGIDTRQLRLTPDSLFFLSLNPAPGLLFGFSGTLDPLGQASAAASIPGTLSLSGVTINAAFVTIAWPGTVSSGINTISDTSSFTIL